VAISWDEALDTIADKLRGSAAPGLIDDRASAAGGDLRHGGTPANYMGSFPAFLSAWVRWTRASGSGQGVKCVHSEHLFERVLARAFTVSADMNLHGASTSRSATTTRSPRPCAGHAHADARVRGARRVQIEPHLSVTGGTSAAVGADQAQDRRGVNCSRSSTDAARASARAARPGVLAT